MIQPYLPDIIQSIVSRIDAVFSARSTDPFNVFFDKGNYPQAWADVYKQMGSNPLVWFVMPFTSVRGKNTSYYADTTFSMWVLMPTDNKFTQQERDDYTIKPRLLPVYDVLMQEFERENWFAYNKSLIPDHTMVIRPYWGRSIPNGTDSENFFGKKMDCIEISNIRLNVNLESCISAYQPLHIPQYPSAAGVLTFFEDIELVVDGGQPTDPVSGSSSVVIPDLLGLYFDVWQRVIGQLRQTRDVEMVINTVQGGFSLTNDYKFGQNDTYVIKIRPTFIPTGVQLGSLIKPIKNF